ncbi:hypothetical protein NDU88_011766 [Pleurodeles waltl]|uniref:Uncharacterized protein n=1 Tax=Pleurodeles waltl TaxID=8319 RepID=A0AAV7R202_PLEWA|nr:hypothetical protein NDU88_011766 [Pleurodeles waltl]
MYESPRGTPKNLLEMSMMDNAYAIRNPHEERKAIRSEDSVITVTEKRKKEDGRGPKAERPEEGKRHKMVSRGQKTEPESQDPATGNGESEKASHQSPRGTLENLFEMSTTEHAYVIRNLQEERKAVRSEECIVMETEKHKKEDGPGPKAERPEEGK